MADQTPRSFCLNCQRFVQDEESSHLDSFPDHAIIEYQITPSFSGTVGNLPGQNVGTPVSGTPTTLSGYDTIEDAVVDLQQAGAYYQTLNPTLTNLNDSTTGTQLSWNTSSDFNSNSSVFSENSQGVEVLVSGVYEVECSMYSTGSSNRLNYGLEVTVNGTEQGVRGACAYIRNSSGHNESSNFVKQIVSCSASDVLGIKSFRLATSTSTITAPAGKSCLIVRKL